MKRARNLLEMWDALELEANALLERWANKRGPPAQKVPPQARREQNNLLRILRALIRAGNVRDSNGLWLLVERAMLVEPLQKSIVEHAIDVIPLESKHWDDMSSDERRSVSKIPTADELIGIIAAVMSTNTSIDLSLRGNAAKRLDRWLAEDHAALHRTGTVEPAIGTIRKIIQKVRRALLLRPAKAS